MKRFDARGDDGKTCSAAGPAIVRCCLGWLAAMIFVLAASVAWAAGAADTTGLRELAQNKPTDAKQRRENQQPVGAAAETARERETMAVSFVEQHHTELARLLKHLKKSDRDSYEKAVRQLYRDSRRLKDMLERDSQRHALELRLWQSESRVQLIAARISMGNSQQLRDELTRELGERYDARLELIKLERDRAARRADRLTVQVDKLESDRAEGIDRDLKKLLRDNTVAPERP